MTNLLEQAINTDNGDRAAKLIQNALGIGGENERIVMRRGVRRRARPGIEAHPLLPPI